MLLVDGFFVCFYNSERLESLLSGRTGGGYDPLLLFPSLSFSFCLQLA